MTGTEATPEATATGIGADGRVRFQACRACGSRWLMARGFCPCCGGTEVELRIASGQGTIVTRTRVIRAPSKELQALAPYVVVLVDLDDAVRLMAHCVEGVGIGDRVRVEAHHVLGTCVPICRPS